MTQENMILLYVPIDSFETAEACAQVLLSEELAACVNIFPIVHTYYRWEGKLNGTQEAIMIIKTLERVHKKAVKRLAEIHPYQTPVIVPIQSDELPLAVQHWISSAIGAIE